MASIHDVNKQSTYSYADIKQYSESYTKTLSIEGNVCSDLFHPNQCVFFEQLTDVLLKEIEEQKEEIGEQKKEIGEQKTSMEEFKARLNSSQKELKTTQRELKRTQKEIKNCNKRNDELNYKIIQLEKYQILSNLTNAEIHQFIGDRKVKMLK